MNINSTLGSACAPATKQNAFETTAAVMSNARNLADAVMALADRVTGSMPRAVEGGSDASSPNGVVNIMLFDANSTDSRLRAGFEALDRISRELP